MKTRVQLAADELIDYYSFCKAIAKGIRPTDLKGIDCIVGKQTPVSAASVTPSCQENRASLSESLRSAVLIGGANFKDQPSPNQTGGAESFNHPLPSLGQGEVAEEFSFPYKLSDEDRTLIEKLLPDLPALHFPFTEQDVTKFMNAYSAHPNRPAWKPNLVTAEILKGFKVEQDVIMLQHQKSLQEELTKGRLVAINRINVPVTRLSIGDWIPRAQAIAYLERCGIPYIDSKNRSSEKKNHSPETADGSSDVGQDDDNYLTEKERLELVSEHQKLSRKDKPTKKMAEKFGVSPGYVRRLVREAKEKIVVSSVDKIWLKKS